MELSWECPVCLQNAPRDVSKMIRMSMPCGHKVCMECFRTWSIGYNNASCPLCRKTYGWVDPKTGKLAALYYARKPVRVVEVKRAPFCSEFMRDSLLGAFLGIVLGIVIRHFST